MQNNLDSYFLGLAGLNRFQKNDFQDVLPLYLKKPQAQKQLQQKLKDIKIDAMTLEDLNLISNNLKEGFDDFWDFSTLQTELKCENSKYVVAKLNNQIVGFGGIKVLVDETDIMNIVVKKDYRNQGIGGLILTELINLSKNLGFKTITLEVMEQNYPAIHLYQDFGFKQYGIRKNYYKDKSAIIMKLEL